MSGKYDNKRLTGKLKGVFSKLTDKKEEPKGVKDEGYSLLMSIIDRKVFDVEDARVSHKEFDRLVEWSYSEFTKSTKTSISGRIIREDPIVIVEVVGKEPVFLEIHDYSVRYRVNVYPETKEVDIEVIEPIKDKELTYQVATTPIYVL